MGQEDLKEKVGIEAANQVVASGMRVGLGTGSTVAYAVKEIARLANVGLLRNMVFTSTSVATTNLATSLRLTIGKMSEVLDGTPLDLVIDGTDAVDANLHLIKGGGGALLREKIAAYNTKKLVIIADIDKVVDCFEGPAPPIPVEVLPHACSVVKHHLTLFRWKGAPLFGDAMLRRRNHTSPTSSPHYVTDNGNYIIDLVLAEALVQTQELELELNNIPGVIANGIFAQHTPSLVLIGNSNGILKMTGAGLERYH